MTTPLVWALFNGVGGFKTHLPSPWFLSACSPVVSRARGRRIKRGGWVRGGARAHWAHQAGFGVLL